MAETIKGINVVIGAETTGLSKALSEVNKQSRNVQSELKQVEKLLKLDPNNTELLAQKQQLLNNAIQTTKEKLDTLKTAQSQVNEQFAKGEINEGQYRAFQRELSATEQRLKDLETAAAGTKKSLDEIGKSVEDAGKKISGAGNALTKGVTVPLTALGAASVAAASDFESAFAGVRKTVDATEEEFAVFRQGIRDMAKEMPQSASEIAKVAEAAGQLGIEKDAILGFTETMVNMGVATNMGSEDAAMALARLATITQMNQQDFDRLGATIVGLGNNLAATESEIVEMGLRIAGAGNVVGMTESQILGFAGALSAVGINAEAGGSAFSNLMIKIANEVATGGKSLEGFASAAGMSAADFQKAFRDDAALAIVTFIEGLGKIDAAGGNVFETLDDLGLSEIRLRDALLRSAGAGDVMRNALEIGNKAWEENVALTNEAEQRYKTFESQIQILWNRLKDVAITLGDALIPALLKAMEAMQPFIDMIANLANGFATLDPKTQTAIIAILGIVAALGPMLIIIGKVITAVGTAIKAFAAIKAAVAAAGGIMAVLTGPVALVIAAIVALAAAAFLVIKHWEPISKFFVDLWGSIVSVTTTAWESIKTFFSDTWQWIKDFFAEWGTVILAVIFPFLGIPLLIRQYWDEIKSYLTGIWDAVVSYLSGVWDNIKSTAQEAFSSMVNLVKPIIDGFKTYFGGIWDAIKNIFAGALLLIIDLVTGDFENLKKDAEAIWNNLKDAFSRIWEGIQQIFSGTINAIKELLGMAWNAIKDTAVKAWNTFRDAIIAIVKKVVQWIRDEWNAILTFFGELPGKLYDLGTTMFNRMRDAVVTTVGYVKDAIVTGITTAINWIKELPGQMAEMGKDMIQGLINGIGSMISKVKEKVKEIADSVTGGIRDFLDINSPSRVLEKDGEWTGLGFANGIMKSVDKVKRATAEMASSALPKKQPTPSSVTTTRTLNFEGMFAGAIFQVRSENDIRELARQLFAIQQEAERGAGG